MKAIGRFFKWLFGKKADSVNTDVKEEVKETVIDRLEPYDNEEDIVKDFEEETSCETASSLMKVVKDDTPEEVIQEVEEKPFDLSGSLRDIYKRYKGDIPKGHVVVPIDGDKFNEHPSNIEVISRKEHLRRNLEKKKATENAV